MFIDRAVTRLRKKVCGEWKKGESLSFGADGGVLGGGGDGPTLVERSKPRMPKNGFQHY